MDVRRWRWQPGKLHPAALLLGIGAALILVFVAPKLRAAEACSGGVSEIEVLHPGDDGSGPGGTGLGGRTTPDAREQTEAVRAGDDHDSGIGGTGVYGTITRTDRLCVNGLEIEVPSQLALESSASASGAVAHRALTVGQVVFVLAERQADGLVARRIIVDGKYAGQIDRVEDDGRVLIVSGRRVALREDVMRGEGLAMEPLRRGQWIAFYGLPDDENTIVISRLEPGQPHQVLRLAEPENGPPGWLEDARGLEYLSLEGFLARARDGLSVAGISLDLGDRSSLHAARSGLQAGARVRVGGRVGRDHVLRVAPPPSWLRPAGSDIRPRPGADPVPPRTDSASDPAPPQSTPRPRTETPRRSDPPAERPDGKSPDLDRLEPIKPPRPDRPPRVRPPSLERLKPVRPSDRIRPDLRR